MKLLKVKRLNSGAVIPEYKSAGAACFDLHADLPVSALQYGIWTSPEAPAVIPTGLVFEVPEGHAMLIFSRSGHGFNNDVRLANCVGVIDSDYRGEVLVKLTADMGAFRIMHNDRIAQAMVIPVERFQLLEVDELGSTERGAGGFGSTGA